MRHRSIGILDIGEGNLLSISGALKEINYDVKTVNNENDFNNIHGLILPGVGAFNTYISKLNKNGLSKHIIDFYKNSNKPILGICVGMQILFQIGEENGQYEGLNVFKGNVKQNTLGLNVGLRKIEKKNFHEDKDLDKYLSKKQFYFTHGFNAKSSEKLENSYYYIQNGIEYLAFIKKGNMYGCQFHPELSGMTGINLIKYIFDEK